MDSLYRTPLLDCFRRGEVPRDIRLLAARGALAPRAHEQLALLVHLLADNDNDIAAIAEETLEHLPRTALAAFLGRSDVAQEMRNFFALRGVDAVTVTPEMPDDPLIDADLDAADVEPVPSAEDEEKARVLLSALSVPQRLKLAMKGTREQRAVLIRDANKIVAAAVLSSPKLSDTEVEAFARMTNVSEDVLRTIGTTRAWTRSYAVASGLVRNPKTPPTVSLALLPRLVDRDMKALVADRNVPEMLRIAARKAAMVAQSRRQ